MKKNLENKIDIQLVAELICNLGYFSTYPAIHLKTMRVINQTLFSIESMVVCVVGIILGLLWTKYEKKLFRHAVLFICTEYITSTIVLAIVWITNDLKLYYICNFVAYALATASLAKASKIIKSRRYPDEHSRCRYDQLHDVVADFASIVGALIAIVIADRIDVRILITIAIITGFVDNAWMLYIHNSMKKEGRFDEFYDTSEELYEQLSFFDNK